MIRILEAASLRSSKSEPTDPGVLGQNNPVLGLLSRAGLVVRELPREVYSGALLTSVLSPIDGEIA